MKTGQDMPLNQRDFDNRMENYEIKLTQLRSKHQYIVFLTTLLWFGLFLMALVINHKYIMFGLASSVTSLVVSHFILRAHNRRYQKALDEFNAFIEKTAPEIKKG